MEHRPHAVPDVLLAVYGINLLNFSGTNEN